MANDSSIPFTRNLVSSERAEAIRQNVRQAQSMATDNVSSQLASLEHVDAFLEFLRDPAISAPIYTLPVDLNRETVSEFIEAHLAEQARGEGLLFFNFDADGNFGGYTDLQIWPDWAAGELGGAVHPNRQGKRRGIEGARLGFTWMFEELELDLICETAALDNIRTARLLDALNFQRMGETLSQRADGSYRKSLVWEIMREEWI